MRTEPLRSHKTYNLQCTIYLTVVRMHKERSFAISHDMKSVFSSLAHVSLNTTNHKPRPRLVITEHPMGAVEILFSASIKSCTATKRSSV